MEFPLYSGTKQIGNFYSNRDRTDFSVKLFDGLIPFEVPIDFVGGYTNGQREFGMQPTFDWMKDRVIPSGRQNIDEILKEAGLKEYSVEGLFFYCNGRSSRDNFSLEGSADN